MLYVCIFDLLSVLWISKLNMEAFKRKLGTIMGVNRNGDVKVVKRKYYVLFQLMKNGFRSMLKNMRKQKRKGTKQKRNPRVDRGSVG